MARHLGLFLALAGAVLALYLIVDQGGAEVLHLLVQGGVGLLLAALVHFVPMALNAQGWRILIPGQGRPSLAAMTLIVWVRESVNGLLPVARVGGELVSIRLLSIWGQRKTLALSSLVVDLTIGVGSQLVLTLFAVGLLVARGLQNELLAQTLIGLAIGLPLMTAAYFAQRKGAFEGIARIVDRLFRGKFADLVGASARVDRAIHLTYLRINMIGWSTLYQLLGWLAGGLEIWIALYALGHPISLWDAVTIEALIQALSSAAFIVPGALGIQEGGFLIFGAMIGLGPEIALAMALARRLRDVVIFGPGLLLLPLIESRALLRNRRMGAA
jgi:putative membrane protein